jgi:hypothetical protein
MVSQDDTTYLLNLVGLCLPAFGLQVENFFNALFGKDMMASSDALSKAKTPKQLT